LVSFLADRFVENTIKEKKRNEAANFLPRGFINPPLAYLGGEYQLM